MLSFVYLPVFIILVYVSGSTINEIETSLPSIIQSTERTFIRNGSHNGATVTVLSSTLASGLVAPFTSSSSSAQYPYMAISGRSTTSATLPESISTTSQITRIISASSIATASVSHSEKDISALVRTPPPTVASRPAMPRVVTFKVLPTVDTREDFRRTSQESMTTTTASGAPGEPYLNVTSQSGTHAYLPCNVKQLVKKPVSWIRIRDGHILTVDQTTFIADQRFQSIISTSSEKWSLQIKYVQLRDAGWYECQVSTEPKTSARVHLHVVEPRTVASGEVNRHVKAGSRVILRCIVKEALEPPVFFNWYFDKKQIFFHNLNPNQKQNRNSWRTEIEKATEWEEEKQDETSSRNSRNTSTNGDSTDTIASLIIPSVTKKDSGNYTCSPSNSESITFVLHVLNGEYSASAITSRGSDLFQRNLLWWLSVILVHIFRCICLREKILLVDRCHF